MLRDCWGSLSRVFLGTGLGILTVSCLTVTIFFAMFADKYDNSAVQKLTLKSPYGYVSMIYRQSIIIAVCGGIASFFGVLTIILSIPFSKKILLMIILGGISCLFGLGCTVIEGIFTTEALKYCSWNLYEETNSDGYYNYPFGYQEYTTNKDAQQYIRESIKDLYHHAYKLFEEYARENPFYSTLYMDFVINKDVLNWSDIEPYIGKVIDNHQITYRTFWASSVTEYDDNYKYIYFTNSYDGIYAHYSRQYYADVKVASTIFYYSEKFSRKLKFCWYKEGGVSLQCKIFETGAVAYTSTCEINNIFSLNEYLIDGTYYSQTKSKDEGIITDYQIKQFPIAYRLLNYTESQEYDLISYDDSKNYYKVSGRQCAKAYSDDAKKFRPNEFSDFYLSPQKLDSVEDLIQICIQTDGDNCPYTEFGKAANEIQSRYDNSNKGYIAPYIKKHYDKQSNQILFEIWDDPFTLYILAFINIAAQCFAIIIWITGRILGFLCDIEPDEKSDEAKQNSIMDNQLFGSLA